MSEEEKNIQASNNYEQSPDSIVSSIATSEAREAESHVQGAQQEKADFSSMFGVQSEETTEEKELAKSTNTEIPRVLEVKDEDREVVVQLSAEEKKANHKKNFNNDERLLYQIEPDKTGNPLVVAFFFLALFTVIIILPKITKDLNLESFFKVVDKNEPKEEEKEETSEFYKIESAASRAKIGTLEMINFSKNKADGQYTFSFTIQNVGDSMYQFNKKYYIVFYSDDNPIYYGLIHSYNGIAAKSAQDVTIIINQRVYEKANRFRVEEIVESKYTNVNLNITEGEYKVLTCRYLNDEMKYYFTDDQLIKIKEIYKEAQTDKDFETNKEKYRELTEKYKKITGFDSTFVEDASSFSQINELDLHNIDNNAIISLKMYRYFSYRTNKNTVAFELQGQGYTCS